MINKLLITLITLTLNLFATSDLGMYYNTGDQFIGIYPTDGSTTINENSQDWVAVYPQDVENDWINVIQWAWVRDLDSYAFSHDGVIKYTKMFPDLGLNQGDYEVRYFLNNSFDTYRSTNFQIDDGIEATISTNQNAYEINEQITVTLTGLSNDQDWVGIYQQGASNDWGNVKSWAWTEGESIITLNGLPDGEYEARLFLHNSYNTEASDSFTVNGEVQEITIETSQDVYDSGEDITVTLTNMLNNQDWVAIYPPDSNNEWENVISWAWTEGEDVVTLQGVPAGEYEVRAFVNNSYNTEATDTFTVQNINTPPTIYEDAEDENTIGWGNYGEEGEVTNVNIGFASNRSIHLPVKYRGATTISYYALNRDNPWNNTTQGILKFQHKAINTPCFAYGVKVNTTQGPRYVTWDTFYRINPHRDHVWPPAKFIYDGGAVELVFPTPGNPAYNAEQRWEDWTQHSYDIESYIKQLEPDNNLISVQYFYCNGGDYYDNIRLED